MLFSTFSSVLSLTIAAAKISTVSVCAFDAALGRCKCEKCI